MIRQDQQCILAKTADLVLNIPARYPPASWAALKFPHEARWI